MKRIPFIIVILFFVLQTSAQEKAQDTSNHFFSSGIGYFTDPDEADLRGEFNLTYAYNYKLLYIKLETGIAPFTTFGNVFRFYPTIGITTKTTKIFSWHLGIGRGFVSCSQRYRDGSTVIEYRANSFIANAGFLIAPFRSKKILFGSDISIGGYTLQYGYSSGMHTNADYAPRTGTSVYFNLSVHYAIRNSNALHFKRNK